MCFDFIFNIFYPPPKQVGNSYSPVRLLHWRAVASSVIERLTLLHGQGLLASQCALCLLPLDLSVTAAAAQIEVSDVICFARLYALQGTGTCQGCATCSLGSGNSSQSHSGQYGFGLHAHR